MNNHKLLTKLAVITALLLGVGTFSTNTNVQTVNAARTHHRKGKYIKDFCVYHVRKGIKKYYSYITLRDKDHGFAEKWVKATPIYVSKKLQTTHIIAPRNIPKYEATFKDANGHTQYGRVFFAHSKHTSMVVTMPESVFKKTFAKGGTYDERRTLTNEGVPLYMKNHMSYGSTYRLYHDFVFNGITGSEKHQYKYGLKTSHVSKNDIDYIKYQDANHDKAATILTMLDGIDPETATGEDKTTVNECVAGLKSLGYPQSKINKILKFAHGYANWNPWDGSMDSKYNINSISDVKSFYLK